ncbi:MAG: hypothetical protein JO101_01125 [Candidatus Eremiobacteraeota bacterium]|nr:hypothetical protein [Candidatus Eremiobacteraeota bacterium]
MLQLVQQLDASFSRLVLVTVGPPGLDAMVDAATTTPVIVADRQSGENVAQAAAKALALDDTVLFGRVLLTQANARTAILQADAQVNAPAPAPPPGTALA